MDLQQLILLALRASIVLTVFGFGLRATLDDALYLVRRPGLLVRSLLAMFVVMPVLAGALVSLFELRPSVRIALVVLAISPVPPLLPGKVVKSGGRGSYGIGLMVAASLLAIVFVPVGVHLLGSYVGQPFAMPPGAIAKVVLMTALIPLAAGLVVCATFPGFAARLARPLSLVAQTLLAVGILVILFSVLPAAVTLIGNGTILAMAAFVAAGLIAGHYLGGPADNDRAVLALATACRHPAIALAIAKANFPDEPLLGAAIVLYLLVSAIVCLPYISRQRRAITASAAS